MPYAIKKGNGDKPYQIVNRQTGKVVGTSASKAKAQRSIGYRMAAQPPKDIKRYKRVVTTKMRSYGETDLNKQVVRINKVKSRKDGGKGEILDTIVHEKQHILHPKAREKATIKATAKKIKVMTKKAKQQHYDLFKT